MQLKAHAHAPTHTHTQPSLPWVSAIHNTYICHLYHPHIRLPCVSAIRNTRSSVRWGSLTLCLVPQGQPCHVGRQLLCGEGLVITPGRRLLLSSSRAPSYLCLLQLHSTRHNNTKRCDKVQDALPVERHSSSKHCPTCIRKAPTQNSQSRKIVNAMQCN